MCTGGSVNLVGEVVQGVCGQQCAILFDDSQIAGNDVAFDGTKVYLTHRETKVSQITQLFTEHSFGFKVKWLLVNVRVDRVVDDLGDLEGGITQYGHYCY